MEAGSRRRLQVILGISVILVGLRLAYIFYERHRANAPAAKVETYSSNLDDYVTFPKVYPFDLKSAQKEMSGKTVWIRTGNALPFYPYNKQAHVADLKHQSGLLPPLEKLQVTDVVMQKVPASLKEGHVVVVQKQVLAVFEKSGQPEQFAVPVGTNVGDNFTFTANDIFFFADPHELYKHWPADVWSAIDQHQAKQGMNELQVGFALGTAGSAAAGDYGNRTVKFSNNDNPVTVTFEKNHAVSVVPEKKQ